VCWWSLWEEVHLTMRNARYYHDHLPIGAEVAIF
jgi:hypothetical protein